MSPPRVAPRIILGIGLAVLTAAASTWGDAAAQNLEYPVKAAYLYKFAPFVEWRAGAFPSPASPLTLCVAGDDPFGGVIDRAVAGQKVGGRPMVLKRMAEAHRGMGCHILYLSGSPAQPVAEGLKQVAGEPVLTVTDSARGPGQRGVINFVVVGNRVRFQIDTAAAQGQGVVISSKLLSLALPGGRR